MSSKQARRQLLRVVGTLASLGLLGYVVSRLGWTEIWDSIRKVTLGRFLLALGLVFASRLAVVGRWAALLWLSGLRLPLRQIIRVTFAGLFASNFLPTSVGGDLVRLAWTATVPRDRSKYVSSIAVDRLVGLAAMAMLLPIGIAQVIGAGVLASIGGVPALEAASVISIRPMDRILRSMRDFLGVMRSWLGHPKALVAALGFSWLHMIFAFSAMQVLFEALGDDLPFWQIAGLWSFVYFIALFPISINSLGWLEVSAGLVYSSIGGAAVSSALVVALLKRTAELLASLPGALSLPPLLALKRSQITPEASEILERASDA